ncbi:MAG: MATE family efflux transporter [Lachnospiraceae bacterium]|nr:MATE family efflux transporter [Lachnospiraceae bacterium]
MNNENPLGTQPVSKLLQKFAVPSIIAMLVSALYNIVDQFFIGRNVGELGNAATNIAFPLSISCVAIALLFGIGGASAFNIAMGKNQKDSAAYYIGNAITMMAGCGILLFILVEVFLTQLLLFFGSPDNVLEYAKTYTRITAIGFPFLILGTGGGHLIRADGSPNMTMACNLTGAAINTILDFLFVSCFDFGMAGAACATVIGQVIAASMAIFYFCRYKTVTLKKEHLKPMKQHVGRVTSLGMAPCSNQLAMMVVQIVMNKSLKYYGGISSYGEAIPIACSGIIAKVNMIYMSFIIGISQGLQPIVSFNYGAGKYQRVKEGYKIASAIGTVLSVAAFLVFQFLPRQIIALFGEGSEQYYSFAISYFRVFLLFTFLNFLQPITSNFFTAIGKPIKGVFLSLTRQTIFLLPLIIILPLFMGIDGILYAGPVADVTAGIVSLVMVLLEFKHKEFNQKLP